MYIKCMVINIFQFGFISLIWITNNKVACIIKPIYFLETGLVLPIKFKTNRKINVS